ncbi:MAG: hypothetical protein HKO92_06745 [Flavobacteriaceae bacterium]|nr:VanZ family protein [Bacteroidia bacterium]NNK82803.1 hypothetical protein [Flavobacteriaceae bacterium]
MLKHLLTRTLIAVATLLIIALIHGFRLGTFLEEEARILYYSYASDIIIPFGVYFLLCMNEIQIKIFKPWYIKALIVFGLATFSEILQLFDIYFLGKTFDVFDILAYTLGILIAVFIDRIVYNKYIPNWNYKKTLSN